MNTRTKINPLGVALYWAAGIFALALLSSLIDRSWTWGQAPVFFRILGFPTGFLFDAFHIASFYLPVFLYVQGRIAGREKLPLGILFASLVSLFPTLAFAGVLRILLTQSFMLSPLTAWIVQTLTLEGAVMVLSLFTLFSGLITYQIAALSLRKQDVYPHQDGPGSIITVSEDEKSLNPEESNDSKEELSDIRKDPWFYQDTNEPDSLAQNMEVNSETDTISEIDKTTETDNNTETELVLETDDPEAEEFETLEDTQSLDHPEAEEVTVAPEQEDGVEIFFTRGRISGYKPSLMEEDNNSSDPEPLSVIDSDPEIKSLSHRYSSLQEDESEEIHELELEPEMDYIEDDIEEELEDEIIEEVSEVQQNRDPLDDDEPVDESILPPPEPAKFTGPYDVPIRGILDIFENDHHWQIDKTATDAAEVLRTTLQEFGIQAEVTGIRKGPVITMFEILPAPGVKLTRIVNLQDNIALRLAASSVRIVAPIPGKHAVGIEIPNKNRHLVGFAELLQDPLFHDPKHEIPVALGKDITGDAQIVDLAKTPHLLIAGATGSGKSVCVNSLICSILYRRSPEEVKMILIDPKIVELKFYNDIPHLLTPVITDAKKAFQALQWCIYEMERRYSLLDAMAVRDVRSYNKKIKTKHIATTPLPYIVVIIDEFADLMATTGKELESTLARLAAMSRAVGIHLVLATQRPSTDVITGLIKANIPSRIAFMVASKIDSRIILDTMGAEKLLGKGDMLFTSAWNPFPTRMQGAFLSEEEVERVVEHVRTMGKPDYIDDEIFIEDDEDETFYQEDLEDPLMEKAIEIVVNAGKASASYLQRRLKIGYNRAARMVEMLEEMGIVGPQNGSKAREILRSPEIAGSRDRYSS